MDTMPDSQSLGPGSNPVSASVITVVSNPLPSLKIKNEKLKLKNKKQEERRRSRKKKKKKKQKEEKEEGAERRNIFVPFLKRFVKYSYKKL